MRQILFLCLLSITFKSSLVEAKIDLPFISSELNAIYGQDDRELITPKTESKIREMARSVALIVSSDRMKIGFLRTAIKADSLQKNLNMCADEKFASTLSQSGCTGFLIAPDLLATAGHCYVDEDDCKLNKVIFDVDASKQKKVGYSVLSSNVFSCKKIIAHGDSAPKDFAIIQLDRAPARRAPLKLNTTNKLTDSDQVFMIGHPFGLPLMYSKAAGITDNQSELLFKAPLDSFEGNSGSPVINAKTFEVEGILVNGQQDLVQDSSLGCYRNVNYDENDGGEGVFRSSALPAF